jgi:hypothetical protein
MIEDGDRFYTTSPSSSLTADVEEVARIVVELRRRSHRGL